jgi:hypothetical protein
MTTPRTFSTDILHLPGRVVVTAVDRLTSADGPHVLEEWSGVTERPMIIPMTTTRPQQRYDHRLRDLVQGTGDVTIATDLGVPRSTARGWLGKAPKNVVSLDVTDLRASQLQQEVLELRRRVKKLTCITSARARLASKFGSHVDARASARRTRQDQDPARRGSCPCVCSVAGAPAVSAIVSKSVLCLATAAARVCA